MSLFGDPALESLYQKSQLFQTRNNLSHILFIFGISLLIIAIIHLTEPDLTLLITAVEVILLFFLQILLQTRPAFTKFILYATVQLLLLSSLSFYPSGYSSLLPNLIVIFTIYSILPLPLYSTIAISVFLSLSQLIALYFFATNRTINQVQNFFLFLFFAFLSFPFFIFFKITFIFVSIYLLMFLFSVFSLFFSFAFCLCLIIVR